MKFAFRKYRQYKMNKVIAKIDLNKTMQLIMYLIGIVNIKLIFNSIENRHKLVVKYKHKWNLLKIYDVTICMAPY